MRGLVRIAILALAATLFGCRTYTSPFVHKTEEELAAMEERDEAASRAFFSGDYKKAERLLAPLVAEPTVSRPLYELERISVLLQQGRRSEAHALMMKVRRDLELLFDPKSEEEALSLWHGENNKVYKGDAHERSTLYAFLAMSFLELGEWDDAERCAKNGLLADSANTEEAKYNSDYALLQYLGYVACRRAGRDADASAYAAELKGVLAGRKLRTDAGAATGAFLESEPLPNAFLVVWSGHPPSYVRGGAYDEIRHVIAGGDKLSLLTVDAGSGEEFALPRGVADINYQATTRGGRAMDTVLSNKAAVKRGMEASGNILIVAGFFSLACMGDNSMQQLVMGSVGAGCLLLGCSFHIVGMCVNPAADVRSWKNLPGELLVIPLVVPEGDNAMTVRAYRLWDNVANIPCTVRGKTGAVTVTHVSALPHADAADPTADLTTEAIKAGKAAFGDPALKHKGEIPLNLNAKGGQ